MNRHRVFVVAAVLLAAVLLPAVANACPVCYGAPGDKMTDGARNGVFFLLGIVGLVQIGFAALFWTFWRRAQQLRKHRESFHVIEGGVHFPRQI